MKKNLFSFCVVALAAVTISSSDTEAAPRKDRRKTEVLTTAVRGKKVSRKHAKARVAKLSSRGKALRARNLRLRRLNLRKPNGLAFNRPVVQNAVQSVLEPAKNQVEVDLQPAQGSQNLVQFPSQQSPMNTLQQDAPTHQPTDQVLLGQAGDDQDDNDSETDDDVQVVSKGFVQDTYDWIWNNPVKAATYAFTLTAVPYLGHNYYSADAGKSWLSAGYNKAGNLATSAKDMYCDYIGLFCADPYGRTPEQIAAKEETACNAAKSTWIKTDDVKNLCVTHTAIPSERECKYAKGKWTPTDSKCSQQ